jgi:hypothetical protein
MAGCRRLNENYAITEQPTLEESLHGYGTLINGHPLLEGDLP